jgi:hypothetical protein
MASLTTRKSSWPRRKLFTPHPAPLVAMASMATTVWPVRTVHREKRAIRASQASPVPHQPRMRVAWCILRVFHLVALPL